VEQKSPHDHHQHGDCERDRQNGEGTLPLHDKHDGEDERDQRPVDEDRTNPLVSSPIGW
jgi:hypothetical protein